MEATIDRVMIYTGALPQPTDVSQPQRDAQAAIGRLAAALFSSQTIVDGLSVAPTTPASLQVAVAVGTIFSMQPVDATAFGTLAADTAHQIMKLGALVDPQNLTITPPPTVGYSQVYLIQTQFQDQDGGSAVLPYYNSANPAEAYSGPGNSGVAQFTRRFARAILSLKAGVAAPTGTQASPSPDAGWIGLAWVTVANGATQVLSSNIAAVPVGSGGARRLLPLTGLAPIDSPSFIGTPTAPTPSVGDNSTRIPTTAFLKNALDAQYAAIAPRTKLNGNLTLYVNPSGSDGNSGLTLGTAFQTIQAAVNALYTRFDLGGFSATIQLADGTYSASVLFLGAPVGLAPTQSVTLRGNPGAPANVTLNTSTSCVSVSGGASIIVDGIRVLASGAASNGLFATSGGRIFFRNMDFGTCGHSHMYTQIGGQIATDATAPNQYPYTISGSAQAHMTGTNLGLCQNAGCTVTLVGTPNFSIAFANAQALGEVASYSTTYIGGATGARYNAVAWGYVGVNGNGVNYLPGNAPGSLSNGIYA